MLSGKAKAKKKNISYHQEHEYDVICSIKSCGFFETAGLQISPLTVHHYSCYR